MQLSIRLKIQGLIVSATVLVGAAVCTASFVAFEKNFTQYAHTELGTTSTMVL
jgi:hypothetical protein